MNLRSINPLQWRRGFVFSLLVAVLVIWFGFFDTYSLKTRISLQKEKNELVRDTERLVEQTREYEQKLHQLDSNPFIIERIAREEYGMRKPGETVYRIRE